MAGAAHAPVIELRDVVKSFGRVAALAGVSLSVARHSRVGIVGPSGGGKTTILKIVAGLLDPDAGLVRVGEATSPPQRLARCALMPQRDLLLPWRTALDNAAIAL